MLRYIHQEPRSSGHSPDAEHQRSKPGGSAAVDLDHKDGTLSSDGTLSVGSTRCFDVSSRPGFAAALHELESDTPILLRVVASLADATREQRIAAMLDAVFDRLALECPIIIAGTPTTKTTDPHVRVSSIPGLAVYLQNRGPGKAQPNVMGSLPVNSRAVITSDKLTVLTERELTVVMDPRLAKAILAVGNNPNPGMLETDAVLRLVRQKMFDRPNLLYHAVFEGGGDATQYEYRRCVYELARDFPGRVELTLIESGGATGQILKRRLPEFARGCPLKRNALSQEIESRTLAMIGIRGPANLADAPRRALETEGVTVFLDAVQAKSFRFHSPSPHDVTVTVNDAPTSTVEPRRDSSRERAARLIEVQEAGRLLAGVPHTATSHARQTAAHWATLERALGCASLKYGSASTRDALASFAPVEHVAHRVSDLLTRDMAMRAEALPVVIRLQSRSEIRPGDVMQHDDASILCMRPLVTLPHGQGFRFGVLHVASDGNHSFGRAQVSDDGGITVLRAKVPPVFPARMVELAEVSGASTRALSSRIERGDVLWQRGEWMLILKVEDEQVTYLARRSAGSARLSIATATCAELLDADAPLILEKRDVFGMSAVGSLRELSDREISVERSKAAVDPTRDIAVGEHFTSGRSRHLVVLDEHGMRNVLTWHPSSLSVIPAITADLVLPKPAGSASSILSSPYLYAPVPLTPAAWKSLDGGALLRYLGPDGTVLGHAEILTSAVAYDGAKQLDYTWRAVTLLLVDHRTGAARIASRNMHEIELTVPGADFPNATRVEAFESANILASGSHRVPEGRIERHEEWFSQPAEAAVRTLFDRLEVALTACAQRDATARVARLVEERTDDGMRALRGRDPAYEALLIARKQIHETIERAMSTFQEWCGALASSCTDPMKHLGRFKAIGDDSSIESGLSRTADIVVAAAPHLSNAYRAVTENLLERITVLTEAASRIGPPETSGTTAVLSSTTSVDAARAFAQCERIAESRVHHVEPGMTVLQLADLMKIGGLLQNDYTEAYLREAALAGGIVTVAGRYVDGAFDAHGFGICYPAGSVPEHFKQLIPALRDDSHGYKEVVSLRPGCDPETSILLARAEFVELQGGETKYVVAIINELNEASMRAATRDGYVPLGDTRIKLPLGPEGEMYYRVFRAPVGPAERANQGMTDPATPVPNVRARRSERPDPTQEGFMRATAEERQQFRAIERLHAHDPMTRFSVGVTSMTAEALAKFKKLVELGVFDGLRGVVSWGTTIVADQRDGVFVEQETGGHRLLMEIAKRCGPDATVVGFAPMSSSDPAFGTTATVLLRDGRTVELPIVHTDNADGTQLSLADVDGKIDGRSVSVIRSIVTEPKDYTGNIKVWHIEALRSAELAERFDDSATVFAAGGGVIRWEIEHLADKIAKDPSSPARIVLLKGLGGSTDKLANDADFIAKHRAIERERGVSYLHVIDVDANPGEVRELLEATGRITPR